MGRARVVAEADGANALSTSDLEDLTRAVCDAHRDRRLECFARDGGDLGAHLHRSGFSVPSFFVAIGPLVEWRKGKTGEVGRTKLTQCLSWFLTASVRLTQLSDAG